MNIGTFIKDLREQRNLSINQLALYSEVSAAYISRIERGLREPSPKILKKLAPILKVSYEELMQVAGYLDSDNINNEPFNDTSMHSCLGKRLKELRQKNNYTLKELGEKLGYSESTISLYEAGKRQPKKAEDYIKIANFFEVSMDYLLGISDNPNKTDTKPAKISDELKELGMEYIALVKDIKRSELTPEEIRELIEFAKKMKKK